MNSTGRSALILGLGLLLGACTGGGGTTAGSEPGTSGDFVVIETDPQTNGLLFLNDTIKIDFSNPVQLTTANLTTINFQVFDSTGTPLTEQPAGRFRLGVRPGDSTPGRRLEFVPRFPTNDTYNNGGFRPGRTYIVSLVTGGGDNGNVLQDVAGSPLAVPRSFTFSTANGTTPAQLFRDTLVGGPRNRTPGQVEVAPAVVDNGIVQRPGLSWLGQRQLEVRLNFDQALNPASNNLPVGIDLDPATRGDLSSSRLRMEYTDARNSETVVIPARAELAENLPDRSTVVLRPLGVLPNNAQIRVIVEATLEDISGESNVGNAASFDPLFATFTTRDAYEPQFDAVLEDFVSTANIDFEAAFLEPPALVQEGELRAGFDFEGAATSLRYQPTQTEVLLNTDFTQITPDNGAPFSVSGGVFRFDSVLIPTSTIVRGVGSKPMVWVVNKDFVVNGTLSVRGGNGDRVNSLNSSNTPSGGGVGICGGGTGGRGSPGTLGRSLQGEQGFGPGNVPAQGGFPGLLACTAGCLAGGSGGGSAGGGGSFATQGDPSLTRNGGPLSSDLNTFPQQNGTGGQGCGNNTLPGGQPGPLAFRDSRFDNDFWGASIDTFRNIRITGELPNPIGGQGGGGGGDSNSGNCNPIDPLFANDNKGGGGGGGGGVLIIKALGDIVIGPNGSIDADGGDGGGGEQAGSCDQAGGGGAGSGGMVILQAGRQIRINVQGNTFATNDYRFPISADGGVMLSGEYRSPEVTQKYPLSQQGTSFQYTATSFNIRPFGGLGGMGVVQLMAPPGTNFANQPDNSNTILDDNIVLINSSGQEIIGSQKINFLGWRGNIQPNSPTINSQKFGVDDNGGQVSIQVEGDVRPFPILLPAPFGPTSKAISKWIDTGASSRAEVLADDGQPRGVVPVTSGDGTTFGDGPYYRWDGTISGSPGGATDGYVSFEQVSPGSPDLQIPFDLIAESNVATIEAGQTFEGSNSYTVSLATAVLGDVDNRYNHYVAVLFNSLNQELGRYRVLGHTDRVLNLAATSAISDVPSRVEVREQLFEIATGNALGLGPSYTGNSGSPLPVANVRIGFAFHRDPAQERTTGLDPRRYPREAGEFIYDLADPATQQEIRDGIGGSGAYPFVKWEVLFDSRFRTTQQDNPPSVGPTTRRPALRYLRLPFQF